MDPKNLDQQLQQHANALEQQEQNAVAIDERLKAIPGIEAFMRAPRPYGQVRNPWAGTGNMTAQAQVTRGDRNLAGWLASQAGKSLPPVDYAERDRQMAETEQMERLIQATDRLREQRLARQARQDHERIHGRWDRVLGKLV